MTGNLKERRKPDGRLECLRLTIRLYPSIADDLKVINHLQRLSHRHNGGINSVIKSILLSHFTGCNKITESLNNRRSLEKTAQDVIRVQGSEAKGNNMTADLKDDDLEVGAMALMSMKF